MKTEKWLDHEIRFVEIDNEWWAVASDVAKVLGIKNVSHAVNGRPGRPDSGLDEDEKGVAIVTTLGGEQEMLVVSETGVYELVIKSRKKEAKEFKKWIKQVIKTLRKNTGLQSYQVFRMLDKDIQNQAMDKISQMNNPQPAHYMKANTIANKAVANKYGLPKAVKKENMTPEMLQDRQPIVEDTAHLMLMKDRFDLEMSISKAIYKKYN